MFKSKSSNFENIICDESESVHKLREQLSLLKKQNKVLNEENSNYNIREISFISEKLHLQNDNMVRLVILKQLSKYA